MSTNRIDRRSSKKSSHDTYIFCLMNASVDQARETAPQYDRPRMFIDVKNGATWKKDELVPFAALA